METDEERIANMLERLLERGVDPASILGPALRLEESGVSSAFALRIVSQGNEALTMLGRRAADLGPFDYSETGRPTWPAAFLGRDATTIAAPLVLVGLLRLLEEATFPTAWFQPLDNGGYVMLFLDRRAKRPSKLHGRDGVFFTEADPPAVSPVPSATELARIAGTPGSAPMPHEFLSPGSGFGALLGWGKDAPPFMAPVRYVPLSSTHDDEGTPLGEVPRRLPHPADVLRPFLDHFASRRASARTELAAVGKALAEPSLPWLSSGGADTRPDRARQLAVFLRTASGERLSKRHVEALVGELLGVTDRTVRRWLGHGRA